MSDVELYKGEQRAKVEAIKMIKCQKKKRVVQRGFRDKKEVIKMIKCQK